MDQLYNAGILVAAILGSVRVLLAAIHWAVSSTIPPIRDEILKIRDCMNTLASNVHLDLRAMVEWLARVDAMIDDTKHRIDQIEVRGQLNG